MAPQVKAGDGIVFTSSSQETFKFKGAAPGLSRPAALGQHLSNSSHKPSCCFFNATMKCFCSGEIIYLRKLPMSSSFLITAVLYQQLHFPFSLYILTPQTREVLTLIHSSSQHLQEFGIGAAIIWAFFRGLF